MIDKALEKIACLHITSHSFDTMENRYEGNLEEHVNLICGRCKKILDYKVPIVVDQREVAKKTGKDGG